MLCSHQQDEERHLERGEELLDIAGQGRFRTTF